MVTNIASDSVVDVLPEERCVREGSEFITSNRKLTVKLSSGGIRGFSDFSNSGSSAITVSHGNIDRAMTIQLNRTIRVPDNASTNALPPSLGTFPMYRVHDYAHNMPDEIAQKGGIFFPMYQSEAMWLGFSAKHPFALKAYVGGVNAVSGFPMVENDQTREKRARMLKDGKQIQDYMVLPDQPWIDGIVSEDGKIRQFVAQPKGSGFSVEVQVTGEEKIGGIQIEIIPMKKHFPPELDVRYTNREQKVVTRTIKLKERGLGDESTWADVRAIIKDEFGIDPSDQQLSVHNAPSRSAHVDFGPDVKLGDVFFPPNVSTISVVHIPIPTFGAPRHRLASAFGGSAKTGGYSASSPPSQAFFSAPAPVAMACSASLMPLSAAPPPPGSMKKKSSAARRSAASAMDSRSADFEEAAPTAGPAQVKEMGIAAGGLITQSINKDPYPADIWDAEASVMLNLQILDPASYRAVTGNPEPNTPATQAEYAKHNYPYFELWNEEKTGVKGDFSEVKSVAQLKKEKALAAGEEPPADEEDVPVRVVKIGAPKGDFITFKSTFRPLEVLMKELQHLTIN